jgi:hypothetical protein
MNDLNEHRPLTGYERRLLAELRTVVAEHGATDLGTATGRLTGATGRRPVRRRLALTAAGLTAVAGAATAFTMIGTASPAYAVDKQPNGHIKITIRDPNHVAGLSRRVAEAAGVPLKIVPVTRDCDERPPVLSGPAGDWGISTGDGIAEVDLPAGNLPAGTVLAWGPAEDALGLHGRISFTDSQVTCLGIGVTFTSSGDGNTLPQSSPSPGGQRR